MGYFRAAVFQSHSPDELDAAKRKGHIKAVKPILQKTRQTHFRIFHELIHLALKKTGED